MTYEELVRLGLDLDPRRAANRPFEERAALCATDVIEEIIYKGERIQLHRDDLGRYAIIYVRVSTELQRSRKSSAKRTKRLMIADGHSEEDQINKGILKCLGHKDRKGNPRPLAFRVVSDVTLSGSLPMLIIDKGLLKRLKDAKKKTYEDAFKDIFLEEGGHTLEEYAAMKNYRTRHTDAILKSRLGEDALNEFIGDEEKEKSSPATFRPGLTLVCEDVSRARVHTIYTGDLSRISRNMIITTALVELMGEHGVRLEGTYDDLSRFNEGGAMSKAISGFYAAFAEEKITDSLKGSLRGMRAMIIDGQPQGIIPDYYYKDEEGYARPHPVLHPIIKDMVQVFLRESVRVGKRGESAYAAWQYIRKRLEELEDDNPYGDPYASLYTTPEGIVLLLRNPYLMGRQPAYGITWPLKDMEQVRVVDEHDFERIHKRLNIRPKQVTDRRQRGVNLLGSVCVCICGKPLHYGRKSPKSGTPSVLHCPIRQRGPNYKGPHIQIPIDEVEGFVDDLMSHHHSAVTSSLSDRVRERLERQAKDLKSRLKEVELNKLLAEKEAEIVARSRADEDEIAPENPEYDNLIKTHVAARTVRFKSEKDRLTKELDSVQDVLDAHTGEIQRNAEIWDDLEVEERNRLLLGLFQLRAEGDPAMKNESFVPIMTGGQRLEAIPIKTIRHGRGWERAITITAGEWRAQRSKGLNARQRYGQTRRDSLSLSDAEFQVLHPTTEADWTETNEETGEEMIISSVSRGREDEAGEIEIVNETKNPYLKKKGEEDQK
jgi:DNA invertase Pin-like site-specific DNA recombinase